MDLLQYFVDVDGKGLLPALLPFFLVTSPDGLLSLSGLFHSFSTSLRRHDLYDSPVCSGEPAMAKFFLGSFYKGGRGKIRTNPV